MSGASASNMVQANSTLRPSSGLFWLVLIALLGIIFLGARFLIAPKVAAAAFGVPRADDNGISFAYTKGIRDIFSGLVGLPFLSMANSKFPLENSGVLSAVR